MVDEEFQLRKSYMKAKGWSENFAVNVKMEEPVYFLAIIIKKSRDCKMFILFQVQNMSEEKLNSEDVFEREIKLCEDFRYFESTGDVIISFNVSSGEVNIWVYYNKNWNA